jgi:hypothetical protein
VGLDIGNTELVLITQHGFARRSPGIRHQVAQHGRALGDSLNSKAFGFRARDIESASLSSR